MIMKNKKLIIIIVVVLAIAAGITAFILLRGKGKEEKKTYEEGSIEAEMQTSLDRWLKAMAEENIDEFVESCYTDELLAYHEAKLGLSEENFKAYLKHIVVGGFEYKNIEIAGKNKLDEDAFFEINKELPEAAKITSMYKINFAYDIKYDDEWSRVEETGSILEINGKYYVDNLANGTIYEE